jgi:hypothetical protein
VSWVGSKSGVLGVYLSTKGFSVCRADRLEYTRDSDGIDATFLALGQWLEKTPARATLNVFFSAGLCRPFVMTQLPTLSPDETECALQAAALKRTGLSGPCQVWTDPTEGPGKRVAAAVDLSVLRKLQALPRSVGKRHKLLSAQPLWSEWLRVALHENPHAACVVLHECDAVTVLSGDADQFDIATTVVRGGQDSVTTDAVARFLLTVDLETRPAIQGRAVLHGASGLAAGLSVLGSVLEVTA